MKKHYNRRTFIKTTALASLAVPILSTGLLSCNTSTETKKLSILILGGTSFLGPHQIAYAISRGHSVTTFTRGKTKPKVYTELFDQVEQLIGDRENNLEALKNRTWDVVIDNSGRKVKWTKDTAQLLKDNVGIYMYTSSTGVYYPYLKDLIAEDTKLVLKVPEGLTEDEKYEQDYGVMKANSELEAIKAFGEERTTIIRPTYMIGPADRTNRFIHWPLRLAEDGEVLVPGKQDDLVQYIDVRDAAEWFIRLAEKKIFGIFNAVGPKSQQTTLQFVKEAAETFNKEHTYTLINDYNFLTENNVLYSVPWIMPEGKNYGSSRADNRLAIKNGLTFRTLKQTVKDTYDWWHSAAVDPKRRQQFLSNANELHNKEKAILKAWNER